MNVVNKSADMNTAQLIATQNREEMVHVMTGLPFCGILSKGSPDEVVPSLPQGLTL